MLRRLAAEFLGTAMLLCTVAGSGIMAERLAAGSIAVALIANSVATGAGLFALIVAFASISGAHFNPAVTLTAAIRKEIRIPEAVLYIIAQIGGALVGVIFANLMFDLPAISASTKVRTGVGQWLGEFVATFGLIGVIIAVSRKSTSTVVAAAVAAYITAAYWFTSSTSFANPAVTIARSLTDTFTGIRPGDVIYFILAQFLGAVGAWGIFGWLTSSENYEN